MKLFTFITCLLAAIALAQPILEETMSSSNNGTSTSHSAVSLDSVEEPPKKQPKCPVDPCDGACNFWAVLFTWGASCVICGLHHRNCYN
ncbi:hypothetical protein MGG_18005 [Pyricularia oryzae 70-15]|uniref:Uncharacterized protein n=3 Tax=Pyricularia oryzae TaxID=318829 RepID=G4NJI1_PYRO7|nr:uncharacterized protein MGG_18005 [Pyricularia oryzae 70-15]EHA46397.1 hypothetical protein MGG_18005 [Pyricularia oryzae 70-15]ELQ36303.1 hypothetical protein OOU_Y34scaffold00666g164 [Pyricularia oryzae Y34]KAI7929898.1 hypothetical protein M9X92_001016 [Pyricularia oryzae]KAI7930456.1 hypothetical protein M0657_001576 [Pyricularia oryzae]